ncbi:MAG: hypothetical protein V4596_06385 [Bdellovibrionota bacterium]
MTKNIFITVVAFVLFTLSNAQAAVSPVAVGIVPPVQFPTKDFSITGLRFSALWGSHRDVYGIDLGVIGNITAQDFTGIALSGGFNKTDGTVTAIGTQFAGIANWNNNKTSVYGLQFAGIVNMNKATSKVVGLDLALVNLTEQTAIYGVQAGIYNKARVVYGLQLGLINEATDLHGIQIGLVNFHHKGLFVVSPIINIGF